MNVHLAQAFSNRAPRGRKHDFKDAERLAPRFVAKELILSFVPGEEQRVWRNLTRMKLQLTRDRVRLRLGEFSIKELTNPLQNLGFLMAFILISVNRVAAKSARK